MHTSSLTLLPLRNLVNIRVKPVCKESIVINDPRGQNHSPASSEHCFHWKIVIFG